ncbi:hypothetical protein LINGRAPRIM_LOCUS531 [Linum grandiflorum]
MGDKVVEGRTRGGVFMFLCDETD